MKESDRASTQVTGIILMVGIVFLLFVLVLLLCLGFGLPHADDEAPVIFKITYVCHTNLNGKMTKASHVTLTNIGKHDYPNTYLYVKLFVNDIPADLELPTLNGNAAINWPHHGYKNVGGPGTYGGTYKSTSKWYSDQEISIDFNDGTFGPGDTICLEVYDSRTGTIISRDTFPESKKYNTRWFYHYFLNPQGV